MSGLSMTVSREGSPLAQSARPSPTFPSLKSEDSRASNKGTFASHNELKGFQQRNASTLNAFYAENKLATAQDRELASRLIYINSSAEPGAAGDRLDALANASRAYGTEPNPARLKAYEAARDAGWAFQRGFFGD